MSTDLTESLYKIVASGLLNWPFLLLVGIIVLLVAFYGPLGAAIKQRGLSVKFGDHMISFGEAVKEIDQNLDENLSDFESTMETIRDLQSQIDELKGIDVKRDEHSPTGPDSEAVWQVVRNSLIHSKYVWRSLDRLAILAGVSTDKVREVLASHADEAVIGQGKSGRAITRHLSRNP